MKIAVVSSHKGFDGWIMLMKTIGQELDSDIEFISIFSDDLYRKKTNRIQKVRLRIRNYFIFPLKCILYSRTIRNKFDLIITITNPFYLPILNSKLFSKKPHIVVHFDIYPESLVIHKVIKKNGLAERLILKLMQNAIAKATACIYLLESHKRYATSNGWLNKNTYVIPICSGSPGNYREPEIYNGPVRFLYCGTLGLMHDYSTMLVFLKARKSDVKEVYEFFTSGSKKLEFESDMCRDCKNLIDLGQIIIGDSLSQEMWIEKMSDSQVGIVFQSKGAGNVIFPSKVMSILSMGQAVLAICELNSDLGAIVETNDCGWVVEPGDHEAMEKAIGESQDPSILYRKRKNAHKLSLDKFSMISIVNEWKKVIEVAYIR